MEATAPVDDLFERAQAALAEVRPSIESDGGDVWLIKIEDRTAYVQLLGACGGCPASHQTLKFAVERAVKERCPEIDRVEQI
jgi:Fe-S cluster biogenesis protein NfuA